MKNFLSILGMFLAMFCVLNGVSADTYNCRKTELSWNANKDSNEYLFVSESDNSDNNGFAFICGHINGGNWFGAGATTEGCNSGAQVVVGNQGGNYEEQDWVDRVKNATVFRCSVSGGNSWSTQSFSDLPECSSLSGKRFIQELNGCKIYSSDATWTSLTGGGGYASSKSGDFCCGDAGVTPPDPGNTQCNDTLDGTPITLNLNTTYGKNVTAAQCSSLSASYDSNGTAFQLSCISGPKFRCCPTKCSGNMIADTAGCQCRKQGVIVNKSCTEKRKGKPVGVACCNLEDAGLAVYNANTNTCVCNNPLAKFEIDQTNGTGKCITNEVIVPQCDGVTAKLNPATNKCECIIAETSLNADGVSCSCTDANKKIKNGKCEYTEEYLISLKVKQIREIRGRLNSIMNGFKVSVWKNAEGEFNTARLASDSIAGVVLGTVGGVVTSKVVKKNQLKKGFEAIQCSIGGQTVADYGDEFVVGM